MKDYKEIANRVFQRRDEYLKEKKRKKALIFRNAAIALSCCIMIALGFGIWHMDMLRKISPDNNQFSDKEITVTTEMTSEKASAATEVTTTATVTAAITATASAHTSASAHTDKAELTATSAARTTTAANTVTTSTAVHISLPAATTTAQAETAPSTTTLQYGDITDSPETTTHLTTAPLRTTATTGITPTATSLTTTSKIHTTTTTTHWLSTTTTTLRWTYTTTTRFTSTTTTATTSVTAQSTDIPDTTAAPVFTSTTTATSVSTTTTTTARSHTSFVYNNTTYTVSSLNVDISCAGEELYSGVMYDDLLGETFFYTIYSYPDCDTRFMCIAVFDDGAVCLGVNESFSGSYSEELSPKSPEEADTVCDDPAVLP